MSNLISLIIGVVALLFALVAFLPLLGWANWLIIPLAIVGAVVGSAGRATTGRNLNLFVILVGVVRLCWAAASCEPRPADRRLYRARAAVRAADPGAYPRPGGAAVPEAEETLKWSAPAFTLDGKILLVMAGVQEACRAQFLAGAGNSRRGGGGRRHGAVRQADQRRRLAGGRRARPADPRGGAAVGGSARSAQGQACAQAAGRASPGLRRGLDKAPKAKATLDGFTPGCRREYVDWIAEAKRDETRDKRIATAIEWLSEGKKRHWKYENC